MKKLMYVLSLVILASLILSACGGAPAPVETEAPAVPTEAPVVATEPPAPTEPPMPAWEAPEGALVSYPVDTVPTLDGIADDTAWEKAQEVVIEVSGGYDDFATEVTLKSVYSGDMVYFVMSYADDTQSFFRSPWQLNEDGTWSKAKDPNDKGGDNNLYYEDKFSMIWPINNSIPKFETVGCFVACHSGENSDVKPYGNKYTANEGETADIWHWKSVRNLGQIDDQFLDAVRYSADTPEAGRHGDPKDGGGYVNNETEDKSAPMYTSAAVDTTTGAPGFIIESEKIAIDLSTLTAGAYIPGIVKSPFVGDRGDITAEWKWEDGVWTIEFSRKLVTGSDNDVQFSDLEAMYYFGVAVFNNAQVRHAYQTGSTPFVFMP